MERDAKAGSQDSAHDHRAPLAALLSRLFSDAETLLLQALALLRAELGENAGHAIEGALVALAGLLAVLIGALGLAAALTVLLSYVVPLWLACASVGLAIGGVGALLVLYGRRLMRRATLMPQHTLRSLRETGERLREELT